MSESRALHALVFGDLVYADRVDRGTFGELEEPILRGSKFAFAQSIVINARLIRIAVWVLAVLLPGGLAVLALYASARAVRERLAVARAQASADAAPAAQATVLQLPTDTRSSASVTSDPMVLTADVSTQARAA